LKVIRGGLACKLTGYIHIGRPIDKGASAAIVTQVHFTKVPNDLTLAMIDGIIPKIHICKALMETSMPLAGSQRTRNGESRAISIGRKSFLSAN
jgi:hypothetical protein